jgi:hypothetical protein
VFEWTSYAVAISAKTPHISAIAELSMVCRLM